MTEVGWDPTGAPDAPPVVRFRTVVVIGGGCYGTFYAGQLDQAIRREKLTADRVVLVDRDPRCQAARELVSTGYRELAVSGWDEYLDEFLARPEPGAQQPDDAIVPSPLMPHLMADWLVRVTRARWPSRSVAIEALSEPLGTPYDRPGQDRNRYVSFADWICPTHCVEPHICPVIRGPRTWEMAEAVTEYVARLDRARPTVGPALFVTRHRAFGVGMFDVREARAARALVEQAPAGPGGIDLIVGTVSSCHGALARVRIGPA